MTTLFDQDSPEDYVDLPRERGRFPKLVLSLAIVAVLVLVIGFGGRSLYRRQIDPPGGPGAAVAIEIPEGTSMSGAGGILADKGVIGNATIFRIWVRNKGVKVQAGAYRFHENSSFDAVVAVFRKGPAPPQTTRVTIPEGLTLRQLLDRIRTKVPGLVGTDAAAVLRDRSIRSRFQPAGQASLEGLLFPATYDLAKRDTFRTLVKRMVAEMDVIASRDGIENGVAAAGVPRLQPYQVLIVASLIQAESGNPDESAKIARVIYNRLGQRIPLGIDATSRFEAAQSGKPIDFTSTSPYNTRRQLGLPPTPIAAPGEAAIRAALRPAPGPWIYYVLEAKRRHFFTASEREFLQKKKECKAKGLGCG